MWKPRNKSSITEAIKLGHIRENQGRSIHSKEGHLLGLGYCLCPSLEWGKKWHEMWGKKIWEARKTWEWEEEGKSDMRGGLKIELYLEM